MSNPVELIVAAFQTEDGAEQALKELKAAKKDHLINIDNAAVIHKDAKGKVHIKELKDMGGGKGAAIGGVTGAVLGILTGGAGLVLAGAGALVGGLAAKLRDSGFDDTRLKTLGDSLKPNTSAIVALIEHRWVGELEKEMEEAGADVLTQTISADIAAQLEAGRESAYSLLSTDEGVNASRVVAGEDVVAAGEVTITDAGVEASRVVATKEGVAGEHMISTAEGVAYEAGAVTAEGAAYVAAATDGEDVVVAGAVAEAEEEDEEDKPSA